MRKATRYDKENIKELLRCFRDEARFDELSDIDDSPYLDSLLESILVGQGVIFFEEGKGMLIALLCPSVWNKDVMILHEMAWYVKPEYRGGSIGHRMFKAYIKHAQELKEQKLIRYFTMGKLDTSPNLKYEKYGFRKKDESWIQ
jgi:N-acetylglutamate synthase-like GNAT family acetyltransferase